MLYPDDFKIDPFQLLCQYRGGGYFQHFCLPTGILIDQRKTVKYSFLNRFVTKQGLSFKMSSTISQAIKKFDLALKVRSKIGDQRRKFNDHGFKRLDYTRRFMSVWNEMIPAQHKND